jgi:Gas vesicle synthesis protein GvpL/GvpF
MPGPTDTGTAWYVYGVVPGDTPAERLRAVHGVAETIGIISEGNVAAIVSEVPLAQFDDGPLAANLHDPAWLEFHVRRHDSVLASVLRDVPVVPFRFGTIYRSEHHVRTMLAEHPTLSETLETVRGRVELGVKGYAATRMEAPAAGGGAGTSPGRRYLEQKQRVRRATEERDALLAAAGEESHARLAEVAEAARANPLQASEASGGEVAMFLNGAYLVRLEDEDAFRRVVASLGADLEESGISFEVTGPWPPYNFVEVDA